MKRFWTSARAVEVGGAWQIHLDERPLRTPARAVLAVSNTRLAEAIAGEWRASGETIDPRAMPLTGLANAAVDHVVPDPAAFAAPLSAYASADLLCYRADHPAGLVAAQAEAWDPLVDWARGRFDSAPVVTRGIIPVAQPAELVSRMGRSVAALDPFRLAALAPLVTIGGSLIVALALIEGATDADGAWRAVSLDEQWQIDQWGADAEAVATLANRRTDFEAAVRFAGLLD